MLCIINEYAPISTERTERLQAHQNGLKIKITYCVVWNRRLYTPHRAQGSTRLYIVYTGELMALRETR